MSYYVVRKMVPGYEDYERMINGINAYSGWPALWEPERYAEGALFEEYKAMLEQVAVTRRFRALHPQPAEDESSVVKALVSIANENGWKVKNEEAVKRLGCTAIFTIPPLPDDDPMPYNWNDYVRWLDRQKWKEEKEAEEAKALDAERKAKWKAANSIVIDYAALVEMMDGMMPELDVIGVREKPRRCKLQRQEVIIHALVMLADENEWKQTEPSNRCRGHYGADTPRVFRVR